MASANVEGHVVEGADDARLHRAAIAPVNSGRVIADACGRIGVDEAGDYPCRRLLLLGGGVVTPGRKRSIANACRRRLAPAVTACVGGADRDQIIAPLSAGMPP